MSTGCCTSPNRSRRTLERALRIPALSKGWQGSFRELLDQAEHRADASPATAWEGFAPLTVTAVHRESSTIVSFGLRPAGADPAPGAAAGQYLTLRLRPDGPDHAPVVRTYSLSAIRPDDGYRISVKLEPSGRGSGFLQEARQARRHDRCRRTPWGFRAARQRRPGRFDQRRRRRDARPSDAPHARKPSRRASGVVDPRSAQRPGARLQAGGRRTAHGADKRPPDHRLQPSRPRRRTRHRL